MKFLMLGIFVLLAIYAFVDILKNSKYNKYSNLSNGLIVVGLSLLLAFFPIVKKPLIMNETDNAITLTNEGGIRVLDVAGIDTSSEHLKLENEYQYNQVLLGDDYDAVPFQTFTFTEVPNITYDLEYDGTDDTFYLYRNFSYASGFSVVGVLALGIIVFNLILMYARVIQEKTVKHETSRYYVTPAQRVVNILEIASIVLILEIMALYFINLFSDIIFVKIYYLSDPIYLSLILGVMILPVVIAFFIVMIRKDFAYDLSDDLVRVYSGNQKLFEANQETLNVDTNLIRNTRSIRKDYLQMGLILRDQSNAYEGLTTDLKPLGTSQAFKLMDSLRGLERKSSDNNYDTHRDETMTEESQITYTLTGRMEKGSFKLRFIGMLLIYMMFFFLVIAFAAKLSDLIGTEISILLIIMTSISPIAFVLYYQWNLNKNMRILNVSLENNELKIDDNIYPMDTNTHVTMPYPDSLVARVVRIKVQYKGQDTFYIIKRNHKVPKDDYTNFYTDMATKYPNNLKIQ